MRLLPIKKRKVCRLRVAHASRVLASASSQSRTFVMKSYPSRATRFKEKLVSTQRRNQHARRVRYPAAAAMPSLRLAGVQPLQGEAGDFARIFQVQLVFDVCPVSFHCLGAEMQYLRDLAHFFAFP